jgi:hypothetical protein
MAIGKPAQPLGKCAVLRCGYDEEGVGELFLAKLLRIVHAYHVGPGFTQRRFFFNGLAIARPPDDDASASIQVQPHGEERFSHAGVLRNRPGEGRTR